MSPLIKSESKDYYNEDGDLSIDLTLQQKFYHWIFVQFNLLVGKELLLMNNILQPKLMKIK